MCILDNGKGGKVIDRDGGSYEIKSPDFRVSARRE